MRERRDEIEPLLELGAGLREATANLSGEQLRRLGQQQHELVHALVQQARRIANAMARQVSDDTARGVEETLRAALADENAARELAAGRLTDVLTHVGFSSETTARTKQAGESRRAEASSEAKDGQEQQRAERLERARKDVAEAQQALDDARSDRDEAAGSLQDADRQAEQLEQRIARLREEVNAAERKQTEVERERRRLTGDHDRADRAAREAERRLRDARAREERLVAESG